MSSSADSMISTSSVCVIIDKLKMQRHRDSTKAQYYTVWKLFNTFLMKLDVKPFVWEDRLNLFVGHLINEYKQSSTVKSYISAIKSTLMENDIEICENKFLLNSLTRACRIHHDRVQTRLPIRKDLLLIIIKRLQDLFQNQPFLETLYKAMISTTYFGLFRIGELTQSPHVVLTNNVHIGKNKNKILFILRSSKTHNKGDKSQLIKISSCQLNKRKISESDSPICPFKLIKDYIEIRCSRTKAKSTSQFFTFADNTPVKPHQLRKVVKQTLSMSCIDASFYEVHGIRSGRALDLMQMGISVETIKKLGRWKSNAIYTYLSNL